MSWPFARWRWTFVSSFIFLKLRLWASISIFKILSRVTLTFFTLKSSSVFLSDGDCMWVGDLIKGLLIQILLPRVSGIKVTLDFLVAGSSESELETDSNSFRNVFLDSSFDSDSSLDSFWDSKSFSDWEKSNRRNSFRIESSREWEHLYLHLISEAGILN